MDFHNGFLFYFAQHCPQLLRQGIAVHLIFPAGEDVPISEEVLNVLLVEESLIPSVGGAMEVTLQFRTLACAVVDIVYGVDTQQQKSVGGEDPSDFAVGMVKASLWIDSL